FYNSATYPAAADYVTALKAARAELDQYPDLKTIAIVGPEDLMGGDPYGMWQYGSGSTTVAKNLQYLSAIAADPTATSAIGGFNIHGYGSDGTSSAGANSQLWDWWANGWTTSPAGGIPANVKGFAATGKRSWMTETSGEKPEWLASSTSGGFPDAGAFSIAVKIHQALTTGQESAWLYWQMTDGSASSDSDVQTLTDATQLANDPKYVAAKHFFKFIRPGAQRASATVTGSGAGGGDGGADGGSASLLASAFVGDASGALTVVLVNEASADAQVALDLTAVPAGLASLASYTSKNGSYWQTSQVAVSGGKADVTVPGYGVVTLNGTGTPVVTPDGGTTGTDGGSVAADAGTKGGEPDASAGGGSDGGAANGASPSKSSGCGCTTAGAASPAPWALALLASLAVGRRRRRARPAPTST
ncbi:MAG TPA: MYXO-CTERM sorting domain-containing protein, partial [Polyangiaceae bacterium]